jgi:hypothetical protein
LFYLSPCLGFSGHFLLFGECNFVFVNSFAEFVLSAIFFRELCLNRPHLVFEKQISAWKIFTQEPRRHHRGCTRRAFSEAGEHLERQVPSAQMMQNDMTRPKMECG